MRTLPVPSLCFGAVLLLCCQRAALSQVRPVTKAEAVLAVYTEDWGLMSYSGPRLLVGVWGDGHAVWSADQVRGGPPYRGGSVEPSKLRGLFARLERDGLFADKRLDRAHFGPDAAFTVIFVKAGSRLLEMQSWHELYEAGGGSVATSVGLEPLNGRNREDVLRREPKGYRDYRAAWERVRELARGLLPKEGRPVQGSLKKRAGAVSWVEGAAEARPRGPKREQR